MSLARFRHSIMPFKGALNLITLHSRSRSLKIQKPAQISSLVSIDYGYDTQHLWVPVYSDKTIMILLPVLAAMNISFFFIGLHEGQHGVQDQRSQVYHHGWQCL